MHDAIPLDVFSSQTLRCCTTMWSSCSPMSYFWRRWRSVLLWRPLSSSATSSRTMSGRRFFWRSSWLLLLAYGSPRRCRGMGRFSELWAGGVAEVMSRQIREYANQMRVVDCLVTSCTLGSHCGGLLEFRNCHLSLNAVCWILLGKCCLSW